MSSALLDTTLGTAPDSAAAGQAAAARSAGEALRQQAAERLAAHRRKRAGMAPSRDSVQQAEIAGSERSAKIAAAVAERYARSQSYRAFLADEAERAVQQARAAVEMATLKARAMEAAQQSLLDALDEEVAAEPAVSASEASPGLDPEELTLWPDEPAAAKPVRHAVRRPAQRPAHPERTEATRAVPAPGASFAVRLEEEVALQPIAREKLRENRTFESEAAEMLALDEEIALLHAPAFEEFISRTQPLPANLIEFPRQLVAPRKARPRLAEGPLREQEAEPDASQLRIFEVETEQISTEPPAPYAAEYGEPVQQQPQWTSIYLDTPLPQPVPAAQPAASRLSGAASVPRRAASAAINAGMVAAATTVFGATAIFASGNLDALRAASFGSIARLLLSRNGEGAGLLFAAGVVTAVLLLAYQALFFTFSDATPGMRCVRIGLCTFSDDNPSRRAMRLRLVALVLSALPFGLGFLWALLDEEKLSWHDRVTSMYQREY